ncbi:MAG: polysaccharide biosynthesis/export family protein [Luteolibacter sp.]
MNTNTFRLILILLAVLGVISHLHGQIESSGGAGVIGRMDSVEIRVFREDDLTTRGQLSADGTISLPLIGQVRLEGLSTDQAAQTISRRLADGYLVRPEVKVSIENRIRRTVTVLGQAQRPGVFELPAHRELSLVEAIGMAGGATRIANPKKISLKRGGKVYIVNLQDITSGSGRDIALRDGDVISIPESLF